MRRLDPAQILADLQRVFRAVGARRFGLIVYRAQGRHAYATLARHYGSWSAAVRAAGLPVKPRGRPREDAGAAPASSFPRKREASPGSPPARGRRQDGPPKKWISVPTPKKDAPLLEHVRGRRRCLKCERVFTSWDVRKNRLCEPCAQRNERLDDSSVCRVMI